jgi:hypothetical protein
MSEAKGPYFAHKMNDIYYTLSGPHGDFGMYEKSDTERWASMFNNAWSEGRSSRDGLRKALEAIADGDPHGDTDISGEGCDCMEKFARKALESDGEGR